MLTIDIPTVNAQHSAEDELAQFILDKLKEHDTIRIEYYHAGCKKGSWKDGEWHGDKTLHKSDCHTIWNVSKVFAKKGYIVNDTFCGGNVSELKISK